MNYLQRKKLAFMSIVNSVKGFVRSVKGVPPLALPDCISGGLLNYTMDGNSVQNGTPTPEIPVEVESVGEYDEESGKYKIPVRCGGKNLFDSNRWYEELTASCTHTYKPYRGTEDGYDYIAAHPPGNSKFMQGKFKENTQYTLSCTLKGDISGYTGFAFWYTDGTSTKLAASLSWTYRTLTSTAGKTIDYIELYFYGGTYGYYSDIQLEEGTTATEYEPYVEPKTTNIYLDEPLRKLSTYADTIEFENQKVVRKVGKWMFSERTSTDYYSYRSTSTDWKTCCVAMTFDNMAFGYKYKLTNYFRRVENATPFTASSATHGIFSGHPDMARIYINLGEDKNLYGGPTSIADWEHYNDAYVIGPLLTPIEEQLALPKLPTFKGTTVYTIGTSIQPSNMSATYYATSKE